MSEGSHLPRHTSYAEQLHQRDPKSVLLLLCCCRYAAPLCRVGHLLHVSVKSCPPLTFIVVLATFLKLFRRYKIVVVTAQNPNLPALILAILCRALRVPYLAQLHYDHFSAAAQRSIYGKSWRRVVSMKIAELSFRWATAVRTVTASLAEDLNAALGCHTVVAPVPVTIFADTCSRQHTPPRVLYVGALTKDKGIYFFLDVAAELSLATGFQFIVVGDGPERENARAYASNLGLCGRIEFKGHLNDQDLSREYHSCGYLLHPSKHESYGRVLVEASSFGMVIVAYACRGAADLISDGSSGVLFHQFDSAAVANTFLVLAADRRWQQSLSRSARLVSEKHAPRHLATRWIDILSAISRGRKVS